MKIKKKALKKILKKFRKKIVAFALLGLALFGLGLFLGLRSWDKNLYVSWTPTGRGLAGESEKETVLNISSNQLIPDMASVLFGANKIINQDGVIQFYLSNLLIPNENTQEHAFLCEVFSSVEFSFVALGISLSGDPGLMVVESPCRAEDMDFIGPFFIPKQDILANNTQKAFEFEEMETFIRFYKASIALTPRWLLKSVRFFNTDDENELLVPLNPQENQALEIFWTEEEEEEPEA